MEDAVRPSDDLEQQVLMTGKVPAYLGHGSRKTPASFTLRRRSLWRSTLSELLVSRCSQWDSLGDICKLPPRLLHHQLLLGV
ncbi:hypothetical protein PAAG_08041 [Paracoccidioides lutzii Pb01]|uniref:Uncharacterized protein n=1 Tax=Paracoccidioides lutzii (strain ATCC MYA-826 / Pb01) TaxID=502779 RepID=C1HBA0_PARBA|nr:hypothetical protein PAAG_08041 [Paracoccidioides lutzii Pb01]EEH37623.2 hypothetical protein PAAG_08041 [Paracoccidioides lutzii Pb01]